MSIQINIIKTKENRVGRIYHTVQIVAEDVSAAEYIARGNHAAGYEIVDGAVILENVADRKIDKIRDMAKRLSK